ncbi:hypothetical protein KC19_8G196000 [Ceratodon purpureus]|uniref:Uncharacterized protein n=1 Tax=Ceratodon purpureus TaxID=3225 RepID=A0A8T0H2E9_CERPU|nr:hypothetical protein KC19_8G196000 [Ceratodon purpureus]
MLDEVRLRFWTGVLERDTQKDRCEVGGNRENTCLVYEMAWRNEDWWKGDGPAIGIDLGTTYCRVAVWEGDGVKIIANERGNFMTPSLVAFTRMGTFIGDDAEDIQHEGDPRNTIVNNVKRLIGRQFDDQSVQNDVRKWLWSFDITRGPGNKPFIEVAEIRSSGRKLVPAEHIVCMLLMKMKAIAENYLEKNVKLAVISVPANFNQSQREATLTACAGAGLEVLRLISEPTAAAIAYALENEGAFTVKKRILVFDLGGGKCDVSVLFIENGVIEVKAVVGNTQFGGVDFDYNFVVDCINQNGLPLSRRAFDCLRSEAESVKKNEWTDHHFWFHFTRFLLAYTEVPIPEYVLGDFMNNANEDLMILCNNLVKRCMEEARLRIEMIDDVVLVGGSTRYYIVEWLLRDHFRKNDVYRFTTTNSDEAVVVGAAVQAAVLSGVRHERIRDLVVQDITPRSIWIDSFGTGILRTLFPKFTRIPMRGGQIVSNTRLSSYHTGQYLRVYEGENNRPLGNNLIVDWGAQGIRVSGIPESLYGDDEITVRYWYSIDANGIFSICVQYYAW